MEASTSTALTTTVSSASSSWVWSWVEYTGSLLGDVGERAKRFARNHKKALIITGIVGGATAVTIYGVYYAKEQIRSYQEQTMQKMRLQNYFERSQNTCDTTIFTMLPTLISQLDECVDIPSLDQLRNSRGMSKEEKLALWDNTKVLTFTKLIAAIYGVVSLVVMVRVQVNVVARYLFLESLIKQEQGKNEVPAQVVLTSQVRKKYLSCSEYCIRAGLWDLTVKVREIVDNVVKNYPLNRQCDMDDLMNIFDQVRRIMESPIQGKHKSETILNSFLLPPEKKEDKDTATTGPESKKRGKEDEFQSLEDKKLQMLLNETRDILESERFNATFKACITAAFFDVMKHLHVAFEAKATVQTLEKQGERAEAKLVMPMANVLPQVKKQLDIVLNPQPNPFLDAISSHEQLNSYSFDILTSFESL